MHLDRMTVEKENLESIQKMHLHEIQKLQNEIKLLKLERTSGVLDRSSSSSVGIASPTTTIPPSSSRGVSDNIILSIDRMIELENENKNLKNELLLWKEKYENLLQSCEEKEMKSNTT